MQDPTRCQPFECFRIDTGALPELLPTASLSHYTSEILLVRSGVCRVTRGTFTHILSPGELIYIAPLVPHSLASADGNPVVLTPPLVNTNGFAFALRATDTLDGGNPVSYPLDPSGTNAIPASDAPARFFRLKAAEP